MFDHQRNDLVVAEVLLAQPELAIDRLARAQKLARLDAHLLNQLSQFLLTERLEVIIDLAEIDTAFSEKPIHLATLRAGWFFVNCDVVFHAVRSGRGCLLDFGLWFLVFGL